MKELVIISGKGGTGKTSVSAAFAVLANHPVIADCDVDAADLHLVFAPKIVERHEFRAGYEAEIDPTKCWGCGACYRHCRFDAVREENGSTNITTYRIDPFACEGCGVCVRFCPAQAIDFQERSCGEWFVSETRCGPMVHARLGIAAENSGKLVSVVRREARRILEKTGRSLLLVDGPPGIGCPVIASVTGASLVLVVAEPTVSGEHDIKRVFSLTRHFRVSAAVCVNKWDLNPQIAERIEHASRQLGAQVVSRIRYDPAVTAAQIEGKTVIETDAPCAEDIKRLWQELGM
ncbi:MAG TPA: 4Fe-4S binding protein [Candidatus Hydrogenedentes bacterium]|nr:4Fe-4S binding protein [Candidatus Hydrogenedentota bacterium]HOL76717.1 4Fe-4S binding protein [Candidatus Hydrogenedentota bacterium]HPO85322.1 4Fe-4S binding protein [Candidatus Hydrogenedentota bacterium]